MNKQFASPGFLDLQVNGGDGVDLNGSDLSIEGVRHVVYEKLKRGTTACCPTIITDSQESLVRSFNVLTEALEKDEKLRCLLPCFHLEGPWISEKEGARGAHPKAHIHNPSWEEFQELQEAAQGRIGLVTLAPEREGAISFIEKLKKSGVKVAIGHLSTNKAVIDRAVRAGVGLSTHLGNGAERMLLRHPNFIWDQLAEKRLLASIIADGHHLDASVLRCFYKVKGPDGLILITDAMAAAGMDPGTYQLGELSVKAGKDLRVGLPGTDYLAGSALTMDRAVENMVRLVGVSLQEAMMMASTNPRKFLGIEKQWARIVFSWNEEKKDLSVLKVELK